MATKPKGMSDVDWYMWPDCAVPRCPNKCCRSLGSKYCWPHTPGSQEQARETLWKTEFRKDVEHAT